MGNRLKIFINCPFDKDFREIFWAIVFTVDEFGHDSVTALDNVGGHDIRLFKIIEKIRDCDAAIHDLSMEKLDKKTKLPRFNMPLELGLFIGLTNEKGSGKLSEKRFLVLVNKNFSNQKFISDLNGIDVIEHKMDKLKAINSVRSFLSESLSGDEAKGHGYLRNKFEDFLVQLPEICKSKEFDYEDLTIQDFRIALKLYQASLIKIPLP